MDISTAFAQLRGVLGPILLGAAVVVAGIAPWAVLAQLNAVHRPDLPWAALATAAYLIVYLAWLNGAGWPKAWREARRYSLRLSRPTSRAWTRDGSGPTLLILLLLAIVYLLWILAGGSQQPPDLGAYPSSAYLISIVLMGAVVSGVVEEVGFRGYMQSRLERFGPGLAIIVTSIVFTLFHGVHGGRTLLLLGPGLFFASVLYGMLAYHSGSIIPGMVMHVLGDLAFTIFGLLGGDLGLLIVD